MTILFARRALWSQVGGVQLRRGLERRLVWRPLPPRWADVTWCHQWSHDVSRNPWSKLHQLVSVSEPGKLPPSDGDLPLPHGLDGKMSRNTYPNTTIKLIQAYIFYTILLFIFIISKFFFICYESPIVISNASFKSEKYNWIGSLWNFCSIHCCFKSTLCRF